MTVVLNHARCQQYRAVEPDAVWLAVNGCSKDATVATERTYGDGRPSAVCKPLAFSGFGARGCWETQPLTLLLMVASRGPEPDRATVKVPQAESVTRQDFSHFTAFRAAIDECLDRIHTDSTDDLASLVTLNFPKVDRASFLAA